MAVVPAPCDQPDVTFGPLRTGASELIWLSVDTTVDRMAE
jgi:hypothetical protein